MLKTFLKSSAAVAVALVAMAPAAATTLVINTGWQDDLLSGAGQPTQKSAWTFTVASSALFSLVDCCNGGDNYSLSGDLVGATSYYAGNAGDIQATGFAAGDWLNGRLSKLAILVGPGTYTFSITGDLGAGFPQAGLSVRLDSAPAVPEPMSWALMTAGLGAVGFSMRRHKVSVSFA